MTIHTTTIRLTTMLLSFHILSCLNAQNLTQNNSVRKTIVATRVQDAPKIDGLLNENVWQNASIAEDFVERSPENGKNELNDYRTKVKVLATIQQLRSATNRLVRKAEAARARLATAPIRRTPTPPWRHPARMATFMVNRK